MTPREQAAFAAGIETARQMALVTAMTIETRNGSGIVRDRAAVAALQGLAEGLQLLMSETSAACIPPALAGGRAAGPEEVVDRP